VSDKRFKAASPMVMVMTADIYADLAPFYDVVGEVRRDHRVLQRETR